MSENKIDKNVDKVVSELTGSLWVKRVMKLLIASVVAFIAGVITCGLTYNIDDGGEFCIIAGWVVGFAVFFIIMMRKLR